MAQKRIWLLRGLALGIVLLFMILYLAISEIVLVKAYEKDRSRVAYSMEVPKNDRGGYQYRVKPHSYYQIYGIERKINNFGMLRLGDVEKEKASGVRRVLVYGDSASRGFLTEQQFSYPHQLELLLNENKEERKYEVFNMIRGNAIINYSMHLKVDALDFDPDLVVFQFNVLGDTTDDALFEIEKVDKHGLPTVLSGGRYKQHLFSEHINLSGVYGGSWYHRTVLFNKLERALGKIISRRFPNPLFDSASPYYFYNLGFDQWALSKEKIDRSLERTMHISAQVERFLGSKGIDFLLLLMPSSYMYDSNSQYHDGSWEYYRQAHNLAKELGLNVVSTSEAFPLGSSEKYFFDYCHTKEEGSAKIAGVLNGQMKRLLAE